MYGGREGGERRRAALGYSLYSLAPFLTEAHVALPVALQSVESQSDLFEVSSLGNSINMARHVW